MTADMDIDKIEGRSATTSGKEVYKIGGNGADKILFRQVLPSHNEVSKHGLWQKRWKIGTKLAQPDDGQQMLNLIEAFRDTPGEFLSEQFGQLMKGPEITKRSESTGRLEPKARSGPWVRK